MVVFVLGWPVLVAYLAIRAAIFPVEAVVFTARLMVRAARWWRRRRRDHAQNGKDVSMNHDFDAARFQREYAQGQARMRALDMALGEARTPAEAYAIWKRIEIEE